MSNIVRMPYDYYADPTKGRPVFNGSVYIGVPDLDPTIVANQLPISVRQEDGTEVLVTQPVSTNAGGTLTYLGSPVQIVVDGAYSMAVLNSQGSQVYYVASVGGANDLAGTDKRYGPIFATVAAMVAANPVSIDGVVVNLVVGMPVDILDYAAGNGSGRIVGVVVAAATGTDDGGSFFDLANGLQVQIQFSDIVTIKQFGSKIDGVTDDTVTALAAIAFAGKAFVNNTGSACVLASDVAGLYGVHAQTFTGAGVIGYVNITDEGAQRLYADLRLIKGVDTQRVRVDGKLVAGDLSDGWFKWDAASVADDNDFDVVQATGVVTGRWLKSMPRRNGAFSYLANGDFSTFDRGTPVDTTGVADMYVNARWRVKKSDAAAAVIASDNFPFGMRLDITANAGDFIYNRQLIPNVMRFSGRTMSAQVKVKSAPSGFKYDWYILARFNATDGERVVILDSDQIVLPAGESEQSVTFTVPDITGTASVLDIKNSLSFAWRLIPDANVTNAIIDIQEIAVIDGGELAVIDKGNPYAERGEIKEFYEKTDVFAINGLVPSARQRVFIPFTANKRLGNTYTAVHFDAAGNAGKISTYDAAGARTDNITPLATSKKTGGFEIIYLAGAGSTGISASVEADSEF